MKTIIDRFNEAMKAKGHSVNSLSQQLGINQTTLRNQLKGSSMPSSTIESFLQEFPDISAEWLVRGNGDMQRNDTMLSSSEKDLYEKLLLAKDELISSLHEQIDILTKH